MDLPQNRLTEFLSKPWVLVAMVVATVALIVLDLFLAGDDISGNTWSELLRAGAKQTPVVAWLGGLVLGHWFHPNDEAEPAIPPPENALVIAVLTAVVLIVGFITPVPPWVPVPLGAIAGAWLWPVGVAKRSFAEIEEEASPS